MILNNNIITLYHGSSREVEFPDLSYSRTDIDFGVGFYLIEDKQMANKWACNKQVSVVNTYELDLNGLKVYEFTADKEWLEYCVTNRNTGKQPASFLKYDVLIGPTVDDKLFNTIDMYSDGLLSTEETIKILNCMNYSNQIVLKTQSAINSNLVFKESKILESAEKQHYVKQFFADREEANKKTWDLIRLFKQG